MTHIGRYVKIYIPSHLCLLTSHFKNYFPDLEMEDYHWIIDPFNAQLKGSILTITEKEQFIIALLRPLQK
jgi:hypothetical protein